MSERLDAVMDFNRRMAKLSPEELTKNAPILGIDNPMWDELKKYVRFSDSFWAAGMEVESFITPRPFDEMTPKQLATREGFVLRGDMVSKYSWTITDPWSVEFVAKHCGDRVIDPLAGTGYWAHLLIQLGKKVFASDRYPPKIDTDENRYHQFAKQFVDVAKADAVEVARNFGDETTLLLAWPPYDDPLGINVVNAYRGKRVVFIGELGDCCGDEALHDELTQNWHEVDYHRPVQFSGLHDLITVFDREPADRKDEEGENQPEE